MRKVTLEDGTIRVTQDKRGVLAHFLKHALKIPQEGDLLDRFKPGGEGLVIETFAAAYEIGDSPMDWPSEEECPGFSKFKEPWEVDLDRVGDVSSRIYLDGPELRALVASAIELWRNRRP